MNPNINNNGNTPVSHTGLPATTTNASVGGNNPQQRVHYPQGGTPGSLSMHGALAQNNGGYVNPMGDGPTSSSGNVQQPINQPGDGSLPQATVVLGQNTDAYSSHPLVQSQGGSFQRFLLQQPSVQVVTGLPAGGQSTGHTTVTPQSTHRSTQDGQATQAMSTTSTSSTTLSVLRRRARSESPPQSPQSSQRRRLNPLTVVPSAVASSSAAASGSATPANPGFMTVQQYRQSMPIDVPNRNRSQVCGLIAIGTFVGVPLPLERAQPYVPGRAEEGLSSVESAQILLNHFKVPTISRNFNSFNSAATVRQQLHLLVQQGGFDRVLVHRNCTDLNQGGVATVRPHPFTVMQVNGQWWCYDANPQNPSPLPYRVPDLAVFLAQSFEEAPPRQRGLELLTSNGLPPVFTDNLQGFQADAQRMLPFQYSHDSLSAELAAIISPRVAWRAELLTRLAQELESVKPSLANAIRQADPALDNEYDLDLAVLAFADLRPDEQNAVRHMKDPESSVFVRVVLDRLHAVVRSPSVAEIAQAWNQQAPHFKKWHEAVSYWTALLAQPVPTPEPIQNGAAFFRAERRSLERYALRMDMGIDPQILDDAAVLMNLLGEPVSFRLPAPREGQSRAARLAETLSNTYRREPRTISFTDMQLMREHANDVTEDRGIALMHRTENGVTTESSIQFRLEIDNMWRVHIPETPPHKGAWVRVAGPIGDHLFSRLNRVQLASPVEILWLGGGIPRAGITTPEGMMVVDNLMQRMIDAMGPSDDSSTDSSSTQTSRRNSDAGGASVRSSGDAGGEESTSYSFSNNVSDVQYVADIRTDTDVQIRNDNDNDNDNDSDNVSLPGSIASRESVADAFNNNDDNVQYIAEGDNDMGPGTRNDDINDNVSLPGSGRRRTSETGSQSGSGNVSRSSSVDSTAGASNAGSAGATSAAAYLPNLAIEGNTRRWTRLRDRFTSMNVPPTGRRYRVLEAAGEFLYFLEASAQPVAPDSEDTTRDIEVLVNDEEAFLQAWDTHVDWLNAMRTDGDDAEDDPIRNQAMLGLWNPAIANVSDMPARHESLARAYIRELRERTPSLGMFDFALSAASALIALISEGDPVAYLRNLTPDQRQALLEQGLSGIPSLTGQRIYPWLANDFIDFVVDQTPPFSRPITLVDTAGPARPHIMHFSSNRRLMAAFKRHLKEDARGKVQVLSSATRTRMQSETSHLGTWVESAQVRQGETMEMLVRRYLDSRFSSATDLEPGGAKPRAYQFGNNVLHASYSVLEQVL